MANSVDPDQTAPRSSLLRVHAVCFYNYLQQTTSADDIFRCISFLGALRVKLRVHNGKYFSYFSTKTYVMGTQNSGLIVTVLSEHLKHMLKVWVRKFRSIPLCQTCLSRIQLGLM